MQNCGHFNIEVVAPRQFDIMRAFHICPHNTWMPLKRELGNERVVFSKNNRDKAELSCDFVALKAIDEEAHCYSCKFSILGDITIRKIIFLALRLPKCVASCDKKKLM